MEPRGRKCLLPNRLYALDAFTRSTNRRREGGEVMSDCMINPHSSGVCVLGTKSCVMKHTGIVERDKRIVELEEALEKSLTDCQDCMAEQDQQIAKLEAEIERLTQDRDQLGEWMERGNTHVGELVAENEQLKALAEKAWKQADDANNAALKSALRNRELEAENEQLRKKVEILEEDAERYQWCLSHPIFASVYFHEQSYNFRSPATKRIDAAREETR